MRDPRRWDTIKEKINKDEMRGEEMKELETGQGKGKEERRGED